MVKIILLAKVLVFSGILTITAYAATPKVESNYVSPFENMETETEDAASWAERVSENLDWRSVVSRRHRWKKAVNVVRGENQGFFSEVFNRPTVFKEIFDRIETHSEADEKAANTETLKQNTD